MANIPYDVARDLVAIAPVTNTPLVMVTTHGKYKALSDLVAAAKAGKGSMNYATNGYGSASHFTTERFRLAAGFDAQPVTFRGTPEAITEVMTDRLGFYFSPMTAARSLVTEGKIDALAVTSRTRSAGAAECADHDRGRLSGFRFRLLGRHICAGQDAGSHRRKALRRDSQVFPSRLSSASRMAAIGGEPLEPMTQAQFGAYVQAEIVRNAAIAKAAGLKPQ